jgi:4-diphosphocytidyl-2-C-methyl-D-erythritol kinase
MILSAPAKLNLCLFLGPRRGDGLHEIRSIFQPLSLADQVSVESSESDQVVCSGIDGPELGARALAALRQGGWAAPAVRIEIEKRIPVAAGLGGGSADAAAVLRLAAGEVEGLEQIAAELGADVPSQLDPVTALVAGAGERVEPLEAAKDFGVVLLPAAEGLATGAVYAEADRLGLVRGAAELSEVEGRLRSAAAGGFDPLRHPELAVNDLERAAISIRPSIGDALDVLRDVGSKIVGVTGSGPTVFGLFGDRSRAEAAVARLSGRDPSPIVANPITAVGGRERSST